MAITRRGGNTAGARSAARRQAMHRREENLRQGGEGAVGGADLGFTGRGPARCTHAVRFGLARRSGAISASTRPHIQSDLPPALRCAATAPPTASAAVRRSHARGLKIQTIVCLTRPKSGLARAQNVMQPQIRAPSERLSFDAGGLRAFVLFPRKRRMSDTNDSTKKPGGPRPDAEEGRDSTVKQSFSHGRKGGCGGRRSARSGRRTGAQGTRPCAGQGVHTCCAHPAPPRPASAGAVLRQLTEEEKPSRRRPRRCPGP